MASWPRHPAAAQRYDYAHRKLRKAWAPRVACGEVTCWRCGLRIQPGALWELGHDDEDRTRHRGPEHKSCNQDAGRAQGRANRPRIARPDEPHPGLK